MSGTISVEDTSAEAGAVNNTNKKVIFESRFPFTDFISEINNTQVDNTKDIDIVMPMYNLIEQNDNYLKPSGFWLWQYYRDKPSLDGVSSVIDFSGASNNKKSFKFKQKITCQSDEDDKKMLK